MDINVVLALIGFLTVLVTGMITPIVVGYFQFRIRRAEREEDKLERGMVSEALRDRADLVDSKLNVLQNTSDITHNLVNSRLSAVLSSLHDALVGQVESLRDNILLRKKTGEPPAEDALAAIDTIQNRINEIQETIAKRKD